MSALNRPLDPARGPRQQRDASADKSADLVESPLFNYNNQSDNIGEEASFWEYWRHQAYFDQERREDRKPRSALTAEDLDSALEAEFPDSEKNFVKLPDDLARITREIRSVVLFTGFDEDELMLVANYMYNRVVLKGDVIIPYGGPGDAFYVVKSGTFLCSVPADPKSGKEQEPDKTYNDSGYFGELALINRVPRAATITALTDGRLWVLNALRYSWLRKNRAIANAELFEQVINAIPLFRDNLTPKLVNRLIDALEVVNVAAGDVICRQGDPGDAMYFIMDGKVEALIDGRLVKTMSKNEFFGERALVLDEGRAATCQAAGKSKLAKLSKESFGLLIPDSVLSMMRRHIAISYGGGVKIDQQLHTPGTGSSSSSADSDDSVGKDGLSTVGVYVDQFWQDVQKH